MGKRLIQSSLFLFFLVSSTHGQLSYNGGHFFHEDGVPIYIHGAGSSFILVDPKIPIVEHNTWYQSLGANANRIKGFQGKRVEGLFPWVKMRRWNSENDFFDLFQFDPEYWSRLSEYTQDMLSRHSYVVFQLFDGEMLEKEKWIDHPFHENNNINGITVHGDPKEGFFDITNEFLLFAQKKYIEKVIQTVVPLGNTIIEIATNYSGSLLWQRTVCDFIDELGEKYKTHILIINDIPESDIEKSLDVLDGIDIHQITGEFSPGQYVSLANKIWKYDKPVLNSYVLLKAENEFANKDPMDRLILSLWIQRISGVQFAGSGPVITTGWKKTEFNGDAFRYFHEDVNKLPFWTMNPHHELTNHGWCMANPGSDYLTLAIDTQELTMDFSAVNQHLGFKMFDPITLKTETLAPRDHSPVSSQKKYTNSFGTGSMVIENPDGIAKSLDDPMENDLHIAWQADRFIYHKMKRNNGWHATEKISSLDALLTKHVQMDIDDQRNIYVSFGGPPPWKKGKELLDYRSQWRKFDGHSWGSVEFLNDGPWPAGNHADLVVDHKGRIHYIYSERENPDEELKATAKAVIVTPGGKRSKPVVLYKEGSKDLHFQVVVDSKDRVTVTNGWRFKCRIKVWYQETWGPEIDFPGLYEKQNFWGWHAKVGKDDIVYVVASSGGIKPPEGPVLDANALRGEVNFTRPLLMWSIIPTNDPYRPQVEGPVYFGYGAFVKIGVDPSTGYPVAVYSRKGDLFYRIWNGNSFEPECEIPTPNIHVVGFDESLMPRPSCAMAIDGKGDWHVVFTGVDKLYYTARVKGKTEWSPPILLHAERGLCRVEMQSIPSKEFASRRW